LSLPIASRNNIAKGFGTKMGRDKSGRAHGTKRILESAPSRA